MKVELRFVLVCLFISSFVSSRLIVPGQAEDLYNDVLRYTNSFNPVAETFVGTGSSAAPVQGIANATSGYLSVNDNTTNSSLFYVFYQCRNMSHSQVATNIPIIVWLQGGAGGSSLIGAFFENGPWQLVQLPNGTYQEAPRTNSWNDYYHLLYIDNPRGTGYSIAGDGSYLTNEDLIANDFLQAMINFYSLTPFQQFKSTPLYLFGESYAGHYIPVMAHHILNYNANQAPFKIPLNGIGLGNAWVDPANQIQEYSLYAYTVGFADDIQRAYLEYLQLDAYFSLKNNNNFEALNDWLYMMNYTCQIGGGINFYNARDFGSYNFSAIDIFMNYPSTCQRYNVNPGSCGTFVDVNPNVTNALLDDFMLSYAADFSAVLNSGQVRVLVYNGQDDIIVNSANAQNWLGALDWEGQNDFYWTKMQPWIMNNGSTVGLAKSADGLTFVVVDKAGHMAPMQQIQSTTEMVARFINNFQNWTAPIPNVI